MRIPEGDQRHGTVQQEINTQAKGEIDKSQREFFLRQQLKAIQQELGESSEFSEEIQQLREKITKANMSKEVTEECERQIKKLERMHPDSAETATVRNYLDWMVTFAQSKGVKIALSEYGAGSPSSGGEGSGAGLDDGTWTAASIAWINSLPSGLFLWTLWSDDAPADDIVTKGANAKEQAAWTAAWQGTHFAAGGDDSVTTPWRRHTRRLQVLHTMPSEK